MFLFTFTSVDLLVYRLCCFVNKLIFTNDLFCLLADNAGVIVNPKGEMKGILIQVFGLNIMLLCLPFCFILSNDEFTMCDCCLQVLPSPAQSGRSVLICGPELPVLLMPSSSVFSYILVPFPFFPGGVLLIDNIVWRIEMKSFDVLEILEWVYCDSLYYGFDVAKFHCFH